MKNDKLMNEFEKFEKYEVKKSFLKHFIGGAGSQCTGDASKDTTMGFGSTPPDSQADCDTDAQE